MTVQAAGVPCLAGDLLTRRVQPSRATRDQPAAAAVPFWPGSVASDAPGKCSASGGLAVVPEQPSSSVHGVWQPRQRGSPSNWLRLPKITASPRTTRATRASTPGTQSLELAPGGASAAPAPGGAGQDTRGGSWEQGQAAGHRADLVSPAAAGAGPALLRARCFAAAAHPAEPRALPEGGLWTAAERDLPTGLPWRAHVADHAPAGGGPSRPRCVLRCKTHHAPPQQAVSTQALSTDSPLASPTPVQQEAATSARTSGESSQLWSRGLSEAGAPQPASQQTPAPHRPGNAQQALGADASAAPLPTSAGPAQPSAGQSAPAEPAWKSSSLFARSTLPASPAKPAAQVPGQAASASAPGTSWHAVPDAPLGRAQQAAPAGPAMVITACQGQVGTCCASCCQAVKPAWRRSCCSAGRPCAADVCPAPAGGRPGSV